MYMYWFIRISLFTEYLDFEISLILYSAHTVRVMCIVYCVLCVLSELPPEGGTNQLSLAIYSMEKVLPYMLIM